MTYVYVCVCGKHGKMKWSRRFNKSVNIIMRPSYALLRFILFTLWDLAQSLLIRMKICRTITQFSMKYGKHHDIVENVSAGGMLRVSANAIHYFGIVEIFNNPQL